MVDAEEDRDFTDDDSRANDGARLRIGADLHCFRFTGAENVQARLLREQILLCSFYQEDGASFVCERKHRA